MASIKLMQTKDGKRFWKIQVSRGRGLTPYSTRFYWPVKTDGSPVAKRAAEAQLNRFVIEYESKCKDGETLTRAEAKQKAAEEAAAAAAEEQQDDKDDPDPVVVVENVAQTVVHSEPP